MAHSCIIIMGGDKHKQVKIYYLDPDQQWRPYAVALLHLDLKQVFSLKIELQKSLQPHLLTVIPAVPLLEPLNIHIELSRITKIQRLSDSVLAVLIEEWARVLAFNFRNQDYCDLVGEQIEISTASSSLQLPCLQEHLVQYVAEQLQQNPLFIDAFFSSQQMVAAFIQQADKYREQPDSPQKRTVFRALKLLLLRADKGITKILLQEKYFSHVLLCLSYNYEFGDRMIEYPQQFQRMTKCSNVLGLTDPQVLATYHETTRIKFLLHVAIAMFINPQAQALLQDLLHENALILLTHLADHPQHLAEANNLASKEPHAFIQLFSELWELFRTINEDFHTVGIKRAFRANFLGQKTLETTFRTMKELADRRQVSSHLCQQFLEAINPFLSYNWRQSQEYLTQQCQEGGSHLLGILISMLAQGDFNTKSVVLVFARNLVEITEKRPNMRQSFLNYFYREFVSPCVDHFLTLEELEILVDFIIKLYRIDTVRTRRALIESVLLPSLEGIIMSSKHASILALKLLRGFLEGKDQGIFVYMERHQLFESLRTKYFQTRKYSPRGITYSLFLGLIKDGQNSKNRAGRRFVHNIMFPDDKV